MFHIKKTSLINKNFAWVNLYCLVRPSMDAKTPLNEQSEKTTLDTDTNSVNLNTNLGLS